MSKKPSNWIKQAVTKALKLAEQGQNILQNAAERKALLIVGKYSFVTDYCNAMGSASFRVVLGSQEFDLSVRDGCDDIKRNFLWDELSASDRRQVEELDADIRALSLLFDAWDGTYQGTLS